MNERVIIEIRDLKKYFPITGGLLKHTVGYIKAVDGVNLTIQQGETLGLVGESGWQVHSAFDRTNAGRNPISWGRSYEADASANA